VEPGLNRFGSGSQMLGDLFVGPTLAVLQHQEFSFHGRELANGGTDHFRPLLSEKPVQGIATGKSSVAGGFLLDLSCCLFAAADASDLPPI
jgi:hypothetical protein